MRASNFMVTKIAAALTLGVCFLGASGWQQGQAHVHNFSDLPHDHVLKIEMLSTGCFGGDANFFTFRNLGTSTIEISGKPTLTLNADDVKELDKLLEFYRHVKKGACTSVDTVTFEEYRGKTLIAKETYIDGTCSTMDTKDMISLWALIERADEAKQRLP